MSAPIQVNIYSGKTLAATAHSLKAAESYTGLSAALIAKYIKLGKTSPRGWRFTTGIAAEKVPFEIVERPNNPAKDDYEMPKGGIVGIRAGYNYDLVNCTPKEIFLFK